MPTSTWKSTSAGRNSSTLWQIFALFTTVLVSVSVSVALFRTLVDFSFFSGSRYRRHIVEECCRAQCSRRYLLQYYCSVVNRSVNKYSSEPHRLRCSFLDQYCLCSNPNRKIRLLGPPIPKITNRMPVRPKRKLCKTIIITYILIW